MNHTYYLIILEKNCLGSFISHPSSAPDLALA